MLVSAWNLYRFITILFLVSGSLCTPLRNDRTDNLDNPCHVTIDTDQLHATVRINDVGNTLCDVSQRLIGVSNKAKQINEMVRKWKIFKAKRNNKIGKIIIIYKFIIYKFIIYKFICFTPGWIKIK